MTLDPALARTWPATALAIAMAVVYPLLGLRRYRQLARMPEPLSTRTRLKLYANVIVSQWTLVALTVLMLARGGRTLADIGQTLGRTTPDRLLYGMTPLAVFAVVSFFTTRQLRRANLADLPTSMQRAGKILPHSGVERAWFVGVALTAGICEEILYRGYLPWWIDGWLGVAGPGLVLSAIVFGLGHAYQGRKGVLVTGLLGLFFSGLVWVARSLVPAQILHVVVDLVNGIAVGRTLERAQVAQAAQAAPPAALDAPASGDVDASVAPPA